MTDGEAAVWRATFAAAWVSYHSGDHRDHLHSNDDLVADHCGRLADRAIAALRIVATRFPGEQSPSRSAAQVTR